MHITKIKIQNFKKFCDSTFDFNHDLNILVGDNDSGKSTILEAIEIGLNCSYRGRSVASEVTNDLFNVDAIQTYLDSDKTKQHLPEIRIELFIEGIPEYKGEQNSLGGDSQGISLRIKFDEELSPTYQEFIKDPDNIKTIPTEFYETEWIDFGGNTVKYMNKKVSGLFIDPARLHPTYGKNLYISKIIHATLPKEQQALLALNYRQLKQQFNDQPQVSEINKLLDSDNTVTDKSLKIVANTTSTSSLETGMQLAVNDINFPLIGRGEQNTIQLKLAIQNKADNIDVIMVEEPENHLSHGNLSKLVKYIEEQRNEKQLFITTHSSFVLNKLSLNKLCLIAEEYIRLKDIDSKVVKKLKRLPGYDTLRVALSKKVVLVEGPSDELILKKIYLNEHDRLPEEDAIDIIVVRGIGFGNYLEIAKNIKTTVNVVKDNDGDYDRNITEYAEKYSDYDFINFFSSEEPDLYSLEPVMIESNSSNKKQLDTYAEVTLSIQTYNKYSKKDGLKKRILFLRKWYRGKDGAGAKKVDSAMRIFDSNKEITYPPFLKEALRFD